MATAHDELGPSSPMDFNVLGSSSIAELTRLIGRPRPAPGTMHSETETGFLPPGTRVVDSAATTAASVRSALGADESEPPGRGRLTLLATDGVRRFARVGGYFLGRSIDQVELVDL